MSNGKEIKTQDTMITPLCAFHTKSRVEVKSWGYEKIIKNDDYCLKILNVNANQGCSMHYHVEKIETFYVTVGELRLEVIDPTTGKCKLIKLRQGESVTIGIGGAHRFRAGPSGAEFIEASTYDSPEDSYRVCASNLGESSWRYGSDEIKDFRKEGSISEEKERVQRIKKDF